MAGIFPGMDPYLEFQASRPDFHNGLIAEIRNDLGMRLPDSYVARVDERIEVTTAEPSARRTYRPGALLSRLADVGGEPAVSREQTATVLLEPRIAEILDQDPEEVRLTRVEVRSLPELELVTSIEVLSPINKSAQGRRNYLEKRDKLHASRVNLVEIDLLLEGAPLPMKQPIEQGGYYAVVARGARLPMAEIYGWSVRDPLPRLPIPLREPDPDVLIDLAALVDRVYTLGRYARTLRHDTPLPESIGVTPEDRAWVTSVVKNFKEKLMS